MLQRLDKRVDERRLQEELRRLEILRKIKEEKEAARKAAEEAAAIAKAE